MQSALRALPLYAKSKLLYLNILTINYSISIYDYDDSKRNTRIV